MEGVTLEHEQSMFVPACRNPVSDKFREVKLYNLGKGNKKWGDRRNWARQEFS